MTFELRASHVPPELKQRWQDAPLLLPVSMRDPQSRFMGIDIVTDYRVPDGVWCLVPAGGDLADPRVQVGAFTTSDRDTARSFAYMLAAVRDHKPASIFEPAYYGRKSHVE